MQIAGSYTTSAGPSVSIQPRRGPPSTVLRSNVVAFAAVSFLASVARPVVAHEVRAREDLVAVLRESEGQLRPGSRKERVKGTRTHHASKAIFMILETTCFDPVGRDPLPAPLARALRLEHAQIASLAVGVALVRNVGFGQGVLLALSERGRVDEGIAAVGAEEVSGMVGAHGSGRQQERVGNVDVLGFGDGRLAVEAFLGVVLFRGRRRVSD